MAYFTRTFFKLALVHINPVVITLITLHFFHFLPSTNYHNLYYITIKEYSNIDLTFNLNDNINNGLLQNIVIIIDNQSNNNNIKLNIKSNIKIIQNNNEIKEIKVFSNNIKLLKIKTFLDFIILE